MRRGFRTLAGFIFGGNEDGAKVAMTAPVTQAPAAGDAAEGGDLWTVRFAMPSRYGLGTLPQPRDRAIRVVAVPGERVAAPRFSGWGSFGRWRQKEAELRRWLAAQEIEPAGPARHLYYDDPFTLPWRRRNEVVLPLG